MANLSPEMIVAHVSHHFTEATRMINSMLNMPPDHDNYKFIREEIQTELRKLDNLIDSSLMSVARKTREVWVYNRDKLKEHFKSAPPPSPPVIKRVARSSRYGSWGW